MKAVVVIGNNYSFNKDDFKDSYVIGVDRGALLCLENNIKMNIAVGDFDSISAEALDLLYKETNVIKLNPIKDETDTFEALKYCNGYDEIIILGGITGKRIEHFYANLLLLEQNTKIKIKDDNSLIFTTDKGVIIPKNEYKYISIFSLDDNTNISLQGFKYNLDYYNLKRINSLGVSNEVSDLIGKITLHNGRIIILCSKDDNIWNHFINI